MDTRRPSTRQEVPDEFAVQLRALDRAGDPLLNALLAACRSAGWSTSALASALDMKAPRVSKRIERTRAAADPVLAEQVSRYPIPQPEKTYAMMDGRQLPPEKLAELRTMQTVASKVNGGLPVNHPDRLIGENYSAELYRLFAQEHYTPYYLARVLGVSHRAITSRLERHGWRQPPPSVAGTASGYYYGRKIGDPGQGAPRLTREQRAELRELWQAYVDAGSYPAELHRLVTEEGFTPRYLARALRVDPGAIADQLDQHRRRQLLAGAAAEPDSSPKTGSRGAPRLTREQRAELRELWQAYVDARQALVDALRGYLKQGFSVANLAQTMSNKEIRVRYTALQDALGATKVDV